MNLKIKTNSLVPISQRLPNSHLITPRIVLLLRNRDGFHVRHVQIDSVYLAQEIW